MSTRFLSSLYFKGSLGFLIHRFQAAKRLLAVHTQTLFIFGAKGIPFIHDALNQYARVTTFPEAHTVN